MSWFFNSINPSRSTTTLINEPNPAKSVNSLKTWIHRVITHLERKRGEGDASSLKLNLTDHCRTMPVPLFIGMPGRQAGSSVSVYARVHWYNAESPKHSRKGFNSQGRRNTFPIWLYSLSLLESHPLVVFNDQ